MGLSEDLDSDINKCQKRRANRKLCDSFFKCFKSYNHFSTWPPPHPQIKRIYSKSVETLEIFLFFFPTSPYLYILSATWYGKQM